MRNLVKFCIVLLVFNIACSPSEQKIKDVKTINLKETDDIQPISSLISDVSYIELKSSDKDVVIREMEDVKLLGNDIIIRQRLGKETELLRFSKEGRFLNKIGNTSQTGNPRWVIDYNGGYAVWADKGIYSFSKEGRLKERLFSVKLPGSSFFYFQDKFYLFHETNAPGYLSEYTSRGKRQQVLNPTKQKFTRFGGHSEIAELTSDSLHLFSSVNDTVFAFNNGELVPDYVFHGESYPTLSQILKKADTADSLKTIKQMNNTQHWEVKTYLENKNYIFMVYQLGSYPFHLIIRKSDWRAMYAKDLINDIDGGLWDDPVYLSDNDELYIPLNAYQITGHEIRNKKRFGFEDVIKKAETDGNAFIMRCKLRTEDY